jgi:hypothetical protein
MGNSPIKMLSPVASERAEESSDEEGEDEGG